MDIKTLNDGDGIYYGALRQIESLKKDILTVPINDLPQYVFDVGMSMYKWGFNRGASEDCKE